MKPGTPSASGKRAYIGWVLATVLAILGPGAGPARAQTGVTPVFVDSVSPSWAIGGWNSTGALQTNIKASGTSAVRASILDAWGAVTFDYDWSQPDLAADTYTYVSFDINAGPTVAPNMATLLISLNNASTSVAAIASYLPGQVFAANHWYHVRVPLSDINNLNASYHRLAFQNTDNGAAFSFYLDNVALENGNATPTPVSTPSPTPTGTPTSTPTSMPTSGAGGSPHIGVNLEGISDWARSWMFVDMMKNARGFGSPQAPWDQAAAVDADGWPTQDAGAVVAIAGHNDPASNDAEGPYLRPGTYALSLIGRATVAAVASAGVTVQNAAYDPAANVTTADVVVGTTATQLFLSFTGTAGGVKNIRLVRPGYAGTTKTFTDEFLAAIAPFGTLRAMDYLATNDSPVVSWSDRARPTDATQATTKGAAYEYLIELANLTGKDLWLNIPDQATDDYVTQLALLLKNTLSPNVHVYLEYSNEVWNTQFAQAHRNHDAAVAEVAAGDASLSLGGTDDNDWWWAYRRVAKKIAGISNIFKSVYGPAAINTIIRPVLASQFAYYSMVGQQLLYIDRYVGPPRNVIYAIAGAPYFNMGGADASTTLTLDEVFAALDNNIRTQEMPRFAAGTPYQGEEWTSATYKAIADYYGVLSFAYEGGSDLGQSPNVPVKVEANFDPRMDTELSLYLGQWYGCGNDLFMYFNLASQYNEHGFWGLTNDITLRTPKVEALSRISRTPLSSFTCQ